MGTLTPIIFQAKDKTIVIVFPTHRTAPDLRKNLEARSWAHPHTWSPQSKYYYAFRTFVVHFQDGPLLKGELQRARSIVPREVDFSGGTAA